MDFLKTMKESLMACAQSQMTHLDSVDAKELGEVIDMIKDLEEAIYYCTITEAMKEKEKDGGNGRSQTNIYYSEPMMDRMYYDGGRSYRMYTDGGSNYVSSGYGGSSSRMYDAGGSGNSSSSSNGGNSGGRRGYSDQDYYMRDPREGNSPQQRRMYMESKQMHHGKAKQLQELEKYMKELSDDLVDMIEDASAEERQFLSNRMSSLATKISKLEHD